MKQTRQKRRGSLLFGLIAIIAIGAMLTWTMLQRSFDAYQTAALAEARLQARASAEGVLQILRGDAEVPADLRVGNTSIQVTGEPTPVLVQFRVDVYRSGPESASAWNYTATRLDTNSPWKLEAKP